VKLVSSESAASGVANTVTRGDSVEEPALVAAKLAKLDQIEADVRRSFPYLQDVHGQRRFSSLPVPEIVRYLHALWICDCKDMLLGIPTNLGRRKIGSNDRFERHEGQRALEVLCGWQEGKSADVIELLELKLDDAPFAEITRRFEQARERGERALARRLAHGRTILLSRTHNLNRALTAIFALPADRLTDEVRVACAQYGHTVKQCQRQLADLQTPLYARVRHPALARRNMVLMNALGVGITDNNADRPGRRTVIVQLPTLPLHGYAEHVVSDEMTMVDLGPLQL
jgi:hypothetical protein